MRLPVRHISDAFCSPMSRGSECAESRMEPQLDEVRDEARLGRGNAKVGYQGKTQARTHGGALHQRNDGLDGGKEPHRLAIELACALQASLGRIIVTRELGPCAKYLARRF
jgi:hypothetical protein